jgi:phasin
MPSPKKPTKAKAAAKAAAEVAETVAGAAEDLAESVPFSLGLQPPAALQSLAEDGMRRAREGYDKMRSAAEEASDLMEENLAAARGVFEDLQGMALAMAKANADAGFDLAAQLLKTTSATDAMQLQAEFMRERFEALVADSRELQAAFGRAGAGFPETVKAFFDRLAGGAKAA